MATLREDRMVGVGADLTASPERRLAIGLERAGWTILSLELNLAAGYAKIDLRGFNNKLVTFFADRHDRASLTVDLVGRETVAVGRRGDRARVERVVSTMLGRQHFYGARVGIRGLCNYLTDNAPIPGQLTPAETRNLFRPLMGDGVHQLTTGGDQ